MEFKAAHRYAPISPKKARGVIELIRDKHVNDALQILRATPKRAATMIDKVLRSAISNADESLEADMENLRVKRAWVNQGPTRKKYRPRGRGQVGTERKRTSHLNVILDDGQ